MSRLRLSKVQGARSGGALFPHPFNAAYELTPLPVQVQTMPTEQDLEKEQKLLDVPPLDACTAALILERPVSDVRSFATFSQSPADECLCSPRSSILHRQCQSRSPAAVHGNT